MDKDGIIYELSIKFTHAAVINIEVIKAFLVNCGIAKPRIIEFTEDFKVTLTVYDKSLDKLKRLQSKLRYLKPNLISVKITALYKNRWLNAWKKDFKPFALTKQIEIVPAWLRRSYHPKLKKVIYVDTSLAFGTGLHESTRFMAQLIEHAQGKFSNFLDIGTGTGILALVALKCNATTIKAIDVSQDAIETAKRNFRINGYSPSSIQGIDITKWNSNKIKFDFVAANLFTEILILIRRKIILFVSPGGYIAVSGISKDNYQKFCLVFNKLPLKPIKVIKGEKWVAILYKRKRQYAGIYG